MAEYNLDEMNETELRLLRAKLTDEQIALRAKIKAVDLAWAQKERARVAEAQAQDYSIEQLEAILEAKRKTQKISVDSVPGDESVGVP